MREKVISQENVKQLQTALCNDGRLFNRAMNSLRQNISVQFGTDPGNCIVRWGHTQILSVVSASVIHTMPERPREGMTSLAAV